MRTHSGLVTDHAYEKGLAYNQVVQADEEQKEKGWKSEVNYDNGKLRFTLRDRHNNPITPEKATATIIRPTQSGMDFTVELRGTETPLEFPAPGLWKLRIDAQYQGVHYQKIKRMEVP
jgi:nitrogen fixation protein FixH